MRRTPRAPDAKRSSRILLPHPRGASKSGAGARVFRRLRWPIAIASALGVYAATNALGGLGFLLAGIAGSALVFGAWRRASMLPVVVERGVVRLPGDVTLPLGQGELVVEGVERLVSRHGRVYQWDISHSSGATIAASCPGVLSARAAVEGLAAVGKWPIVWRTPEGEELERRQPNELDVPLAVREARQPWIPRDLPRPYDASYEVHPLDGGLRGVRLVHKGGVGRWLRIEGIGQLIGFSATLLVLVSASGGWWVAVIPAAVPLFLVPLLTPDIEVSRSGIRLVHRAFGGLLRYRRWLPAAEIESLYVDTMPGKRLVAVSDRSQRTIAHVSDAFEARWLRGAIVRALVGEDVVISTPEIASAPSAGDFVRIPGGANAAAPAGEGLPCIACGHDGLERLGGELEEHACPSCRARFLPREGVERLVEQELGITRDMLRELTRYFVGERRPCPSCRSRMSAVRLKGVMADLCQGCGGLWLDQGELTQLSSGRYEG